MQVQMQTAHVLPQTGVAQGTDSMSPELARLLSRASAQASQGGTLHGLLAQFLPLLLRASGAQAGLVRALGDDPSERSPETGGTHGFGLVSASGLDTALLEIEQQAPLLCGVCGHAARQGAAVWVSASQQCQPQGQSPWASEFAAMLVVPMRHGDSLQGLYNLFFTRAQPPASSVSDMLGAVGDLLGLALHSARQARERLRASVMDERRLMASEVHDGIAQTLVYAKLRLPLLEDAIDQGQQAQARRYCDDLELALTGMHSHLRDLMDNLRTPLPPRGLLVGLQDMAHTFRSRSGVSLDLRCEDSLPELPVEHEVQVLHIVQEALTNVLRHSGASHVLLQLQQHAEQGLEIRIDDNGCGMGDAPPEPGHYGLQIMRERAERMGAELQMAGVKPRGTSVVLKLATSAAGGSNP